MKYSFLSAYYLRYLVRNKECSMKGNQTKRAMLGMVIIMLLSSVTLESTSFRFSPVGTWEYSVPGVEAGYEKGSMVIAKVDRDYKVTMILNEYSKTEAEEIVYKRKTLSFTIVVEGEEIQVKGSFNGDDFQGTITYSSGEFNILARRTV